MNIFYLNKNPSLAVLEYIDKHVVKMTTEYAQILSTAHRVLDGKKQYELTKNNRKVARYILPDYRNNIVYKATHVNHPACIWARQSSENYKWLYELYLETCKEYTYRYGKVHKSIRTGLADVLQSLPNNIDVGILTVPPQTMPEAYRGDSTIEAYRTFYRQDKKEFATWRKRTIPIWFTS